MLDVKQVKAGPLGNTSKFASVRALRRWDWQVGAVQAAPWHSVRYCMRVVQPVAAGVKGLYAAKHRSAHYAGLMRCNSVWACPVCSAIITERRRAELRGALDSHPQFTPIMVTVTLEHHAGERLADVLDALKEGLRFVRAGWGWADLGEGLQLVGSITATEITWGPAHGWHPHAHILLLSSLQPEDIDGAAVRCIVRRKMLRWSERHGTGRWVHPEHGVTVVVGDAAAGDYVSKWGAPEELTKSNAKVAKGDHFSAWGLLARFTEVGDSQAGELFGEYVRATYGRRLLRYSAGLRAILGLDRELTDGELIEQQQAEAVEVLLMNREQWAAIVGNAVRGELLAVIRDSQGDPAAAWAFVRRFWQDRSEGGDDG